MGRRLLLLAAILLAALCHSGGVSAEEASSHSELRGVLKDIKYDHNIEFLDDVNDINKSHHRKLQFDNGGGATSTTTTTCNTWCKLKESLGLTIIGLLLICIR